MKDYEEPYDSIVKCAKQMNAQNLSV